MAAQILLLEGDRLLGRTYKSYLEAKGHQVDWHSDLQKAILTADKKQPHIVIVDLILASRSGIEFLYELRSYPEWQNLPVIVLGSLPIEDKTNYAIALDQLNISKYFYKPATSLSKLNSEIDTLIQLSRV